MARCELRRTVSATVREAWARPPQPSHTVVPSTVGRASSSGTSSKRSARPTVTSVSLMTARAPAPGSATKPVARGTAMARLAAAATMARATGCSLPDSTAAAARRAWSLGRRPAVLTSTRVISPVVTVPVLSSTTVSMRRVSSSTSAPLMRMPSRAPRPVPTSSAVGVARPSAHGQAMTSTAIATSSARAGSPVADPPAGEGQRGEDEHDRHEDGRDAVGQALDRAPWWSGRARRAGRCRPGSCRSRRGWPRRPGGRSC